MIDIISLWSIFTTVFFIVFALLKIIAPYTTTKEDDKIVAILNKIMTVFSVKTSNKKVTIKIK